MIAILPGALCDTRDEADAAVGVCDPETPSGLLACAPSGSDTPGEAAEAEHADDKGNKPDAGDYYRQHGGT